MKVRFIWPVTRKMTSYEAEKETEEKDERPKSNKQESADLEKVTDYAEETEFKVDANNLKAINLIGAQRAKENQARDEELAKVSITKDDVDLIVRELEITKQQAEMALRQSSGDVVQALVRLLS